MKQRATYITKCDHGRNMAIFSILELSSVDAEMLQEF